MKIIASMRLECMTCRFAVDYSDATDRAEVYCHLNPDRKYILNPEKQFCFKHQYE